MLTFRHKHVKLLIILSAAEGHQKTTSLKGGFFQTQPSIFSHSPSYIIHIRLVLKLSAGFRLHLIQAQYVIGRLLVPFYYPAQGGEAKTTT